MKAKVFISWSGPMSLAVAKALRDWLPSVIQAVEPWMSEDDIGKGIRWSAELANQLEQTRVGVICLTPENLASPWIHFEAGALAKTLKDTYVCPYLFELEPSDISGPLTQFQVTRAEKEDTRKLVHTINEALKDEALPEGQLDKYFDRWWPDLEQQLEKIARTPEASGPQRSDREILEEILESVRRLTRVETATASVVELMSAGDLETFVRIWASLGRRSLFEAMGTKPSSPLPPVKDDTSNDT